MASDDQYSDYHSDEEINLFIPSQYNLDKYDEYLMFGKPDEIQTMEPCEYCGRKFYPESLERHRFPCYKSQEKQRKLQEREAAKKALITDEQKKMQDKTVTRRVNRMRSWRIRHLEFINAVVAARDYNNAKLAGLPIPEPTPSLFMNPEFRKCETCARRFNEQAYFKHAPRCKEERLQRERNIKMQSAKTNSSTPTISDQLNHSLIDKIRGSPWSRSNSGLSSRPSTSVSDYVREHLAIIKAEEANMKRSSPAAHVQQNQQRNVSSQNRGSPFTPTPSRKASQLPVSSQPQQTMNQFVDLNTLLQNPLLLGQLANLACNQSAMNLYGVGGNGGIVGGHMSSPSISSSMQQMISITPQMNCTPVPNNCQFNAFSEQMKIDNQQQQQGDFNLQMQSTPSQCMSKFCHECGSRYSNEGKFCGECGASRMQLLA